MKILSRQKEKYTLYFGVEIYEAYVQEVTFSNYFLQ